MLRALLRRGGILLLALPLACRAPAATPAAALGAGPRWSVIGASVEGRELGAATYGRGPLRVYWIGGIHGDEPEGGRELAALLEVLSTPAVQALYTVRVLDDANPDGTAASTRRNARGVDLNRNLPAGNFSPAAGRGAEPLSEPETRAFWDDLVAFEPDLVVVNHAAARGPFVNFDGPAEDWARRFLQGAREVDPRWRLVPDMGYATPGSLGTALGVDRSVPILTLEFRRGDSPELVRRALAAGALTLLR
jgi:murein peptide amidase A